MKKISKIFVNLTIALLVLIFLVRIIQGCVSERKKDETQVSNSNEAVKKYESLYYILAQRDSINRLILKDNYTDGSFHQIIVKDSNNNQ